MKINQRWTYPILGLALLAMVFTGSLIPTQEHGFLGSIAAKVDDQEISKAEFSRTYQMQKQQYELYGRKPENLAFQTMRKLIQKRAWFEVARNNGALASKEEFTNAILENSPGLSRAEFKQWVTRQGFTEAQYAELVQAEVSGFKLNEYISKLAFVPSYEKKIDGLLKDTKIELAYLKIDREGENFSKKVDPKTLEAFLSDEATKTQVENYYNAHLEDYQQERAVKISNLLVNTSKRSQADADKKAENLLKQVNKSKNKLKTFEELVKKETDEPNGKSKKGNLGYVSSKSQEVPGEILDAALKLKKVGETSQVVKTKFGYHILIATAIKEARNVSLEDAKQAIALSILEKRQRRKDSNDFTNKLHAALKENKSIEKLLKDHKLKWQTHSIALSPQRSYYQVVPVQEFHKVALELSKQKPIADDVIRQKDANYIVKYVSRKEPKADQLAELDNNQMFDRAKFQYLLYLYRDKIFNKEFDVDGAFRGGSNNNHKIKVNFKYLALDQQDKA